MINVEVENKKFKEFCQQLAKMSGKSFEQVVKTQAGSILKRAMSKTKAANLSELKAKLEARELAKMERGYFPNRDGTAIILGTKTKMKFWKDWSDKTGKLTLYAVADKDRRWGDRRWYRYQSANSRIAMKLKKISQKILGARGFSKQTWLNIAKAYGVDYILNAPAYVKKAKSTARKIYKNTEATEHFTQRDAYVQFKQMYRNLTENGFAAIVLKAAIRARIRAFMKDVKDGVFADAKKRASRYPGIFIKETP